jgi:hypothetical protein
MATSYILLYSWFQFAPPAYHWLECRCLHLKPSYCYLNTPNTLEYLNTALVRSRSHIATDGQSVSKSWCRTPADIYYSLTITVLLLWGALSDERTGPSFVYAAGPCQSSISRARVPWDSRPYFTVSDLIRWWYSTRLHTRAPLPWLFLESRYIASAPTTQKTPYIVAEKCLPQRCTVAAAAPTVQETPYFYCCLTCIRSRSV